MFGFVFYLIVFAVVSWMRRSRRVKGRGLCNGCTFAHIQPGANAKTDTFCTFGGVVRPMRLDVLYCTDYRDRNAPLRANRVGFVRDLETAEVA